MVAIYNTRTIKNMLPEDAVKIQAAGVPLETYLNNYVDLGPNNKSAIIRFSYICKAIYEHGLPLPPSPFVDFIADRTTGKSKQDFTMIVDAKKGWGKSYSSAYIAGRYAMELADRFKQDPKDYFSLSNTALLEDTEGITKILDEADKQQAIIIDDAGTAIGSRDFAQTKNKNFNKILSTCRTKRWFVILNVPISSHLDLQVRELVDANAHIYKPYHEAGFNILKINSSESTYRMGKKKVYEKRFSFFDRKFDFWCSYSPDILDPFKGFIEKYDKQRDEAATRIISEITSQEKDRKNPVSNRDKKKKENVEKFGQKIKDMVEEGKSFRAICRKTGLTDYMANVVLSEMGLK
jgi:hypothetical protein